MPFVLGVHSSYLSEVKKLPLEEVLSPLPVLVRALSGVPGDVCGPGPLRSECGARAALAARAHCAAAHRRRARRRCRYAPPHTAPARAHAALGWEHRDTAVKAAAAELLVKLLGSYLWFFDTTPQGEVSFNRELLLRSIADFDSREVPPSVIHFVPRFGRDPSVTRSCATSSRRRSSRSSSARGSARSRCARCTRSPPTLIALRSRCASRARRRVSTRTCRSPPLFPS